jgi:hypothetical protein
VTVTETSSGKIIPAQLNNGLLNFYGDPGKDYTINVQHSSQKSLTEEINVPIEANELDPISLSLVESEPALPLITSATLATTHTTPDQIQVVGRVVNGHGTMLNEVVVTVTDKSTGEKTPSRFKNGLLNFNGNIGKSYIISASTNDYKTVTQEIELSEVNKDVEKVSITIDEPRPVTFEMAARIFKEEDQTPLPGAKVIVTSFTEPDIELEANDNGLVKFKLPDATAYMIFATRDEYSGMHTGIAESGTDQSSITHPVPASKDQKNVPVLARLMNAAGETVNKSDISVTNKSTGESIPVEIQNGTLSFVGEQGQDYILTSEGYNSLIALKKISIPQRTK